MPSLDLGGKCVPGKILLLKAAVDRKGAPVGADAVSPKYNTPKCEFIAQLVWVDDVSSPSPSGVWVGAHPGLGERLAEAMVKGGHLDGIFAEGPVVSYEREVKGITGDNSRADFVLMHGLNGEGTCRSVLEVKTVVDTDVAAAQVIICAPEEPISKKKKTAAKANERVFVSHDVPYVRHALFPWGRGTQTGPDGERVVSARAIKHLDELAALARGDRRVRADPGDGAGKFEDSGGERLGASILFVVTRADAMVFRPNHEACPSFARHLMGARDAGVGVFAHRVTWGEGSDEGKAFYSGDVPVKFTIAS